MQAMVVAIWIGFCSKVQASWWSRANPNRHSILEKTGWQLIAKGWLMWACWTTCVLMLSTFVAINIATKCMPACFAVKGLLVQLLDATVGALQAVLGAFVLPAIAMNTRRTHKIALLNFASMFSTCLVLSAPHLCNSAFLKHAFREVTCGFCKGTVPGPPPRPSPGP